MEGMGAQLPESSYCLSRRYVYESHDPIKFFQTDLTTYDTVKQAILRSTRLEDNAFTHVLSRCKIINMHKILWVL